MEYLLTFLEGLASFISPCLLPMLPIYISYFMGEEEKSKKKDARKKEHLMKWTPNSSQQKKSINKKARANVSEFI